MNDKMNINKKLEEMKAARSARYAKDDDCRAKHDVFVDAQYVYRNALRDSRHDPCDFEDKLRILKLSVDSAFMDYSKACDVCRDAAKKG